MLKSKLTKLKKLHLPKLTQEKGQSIVIIAFAMVGLIAMLGIALDLGLVYIERNRINRTTDAAALGAVVELPYEQDAMERAIEYIGLNGYDIGQDTEILVRGCADLARTSTGAALSPSNVSELNTTPISRTNTVTGALYIAAIDQPPRATFLIDTGAFQSGNDDNDDDEECNPTIELYGTANKIQVRGVVNVRMNFMQFFGFGTIPVQDEATAENVTNLDVVVVFDVSGSMEFETNCYDCWVRTSYDPNFPDNGYFNPLPYNPAWADSFAGDGGQSIPASSLCTAAPAPSYTAGNGRKYIVHESELYSEEQGNWDSSVRTPGQGYWVIQRGSRNNGNDMNIEEVPPATGTNDEGNNQGNRAGSLLNQSSSVCNPVAGGLDCDIGNGGNANLVCDDDQGSTDDYVVDCSAFIKAHPYPTYSQGSATNAKLQGAAYNDECFSGGSLSGACWNGNSEGPGPSNVPWVEYDFTPTWGNDASNSQTYIWLRVIGGGSYAFQWDGDVPGTMSGYRNTMFWQVDGGNIVENTDATATGSGWRDNRATRGEWDWIKLNGTGLSLDATQHKLRIYQGSAGYKIDKIIFTNESGGSDGNPPSAMGLNDNKGPAASNGSATREACNVCNPAYGYGVPNPADPDPLVGCSCSQNHSEATANGYGTGDGCTLTLEPTVYLNDDLYSGIQPIRGAQEAVKRFIYRLDPKYDQVAIVPFTTNAVNEGGSRSKLQCLRWASANNANCFDVSAGTPISYTYALQTIERQWPRGGTDIAEGVREGLVELGVAGYATDSSCSNSVPGTTGYSSGNITDGTACDRSGAARRIIILLTDGAPNQNPGSCTPGGGRPDLWNGLVGPNDDSYECAMYFAWEASNNNVSLYVIGLGAGVNIDLLNAMATGVDSRGGVVGDANDVTMFNGRGQFFNAATPNELDAIFETILSNIYVRIVG